MKKLFIPTKAKYSELTSEEISKISKKLPKNIAIAYSIQFQDMAKKIREQLSKDKNIRTFSQVLGCSYFGLNKIKENKNPQKTQAVLLLSTGKFHGASIASNLNVDVYILETARSASTKNNFELRKISENEIEKLEKNKKASYVNFLNSTEVGIIMSLKPGQKPSETSFNKIKEIKETLEDKYGKNVYLFLSNDIDFNDLENYKIQSWINTACPRMDLDSEKIINLKDVKKFLNYSL